MFISNLLIGNLIGVVVTLFVILIAYYKWTYQYWRRKNIPYLEPQIPFGNVVNSLLDREHIGVKIKGIYDVIKEKGWKHGGLYFLLSPVYFVVDLDYIKNIMAKDFNHFVDRGLYYNEKDDPLSAHLVNIGGTKWRNLRTKLTPTFTSGKMKLMFQALVECETNLQKKMEMDYIKKEPLDIKEILGCFTTDIIGSCAFGLECRTFENENSPFREFGRRIFARSTLGRLKRVFVSNYPNFSRALGLALIPRDISGFFMKIVKDTVAYREKNQITRNDFIQLLINLKNNKSAELDGYQHDGQTLTIEEIAAESFVFFVAGFETSSTAMTFALYELSRNPNIQEKLRNEIKTVLAKHGGKITYDSIQDMKYMNQVIDETLRKFPPVALLPRRCVKDYKIPDQDVVIEKGTSVLIPVLGIHYDEEYYPDPEKFDSERFSEENKSSRHSYAHIPFGEGPRICIGMRFGLMQTKVGLTSLLRRFKFTVNKKTREPLVMRPNSLVLSAEGEIWLNAQKI